MLISMDLSETLLCCKHSLLTLLVVGFVLCFLKLCFCVEGVLFCFCFWCRELARSLGEKGVIVFSDFEHVIQKGISSFVLLCCVFFYWLLEDILV